MREFNSLSHPEDFQAEYQRLTDIIVHLGNEAETESTLPRATLAESCTRLERLINICTATLEALHEWQETLIQERQLPHPLPPERAIEIENKLAEIGQNISHVGEKITVYKYTRDAALHRLKLESSQSPHDESQNTHEEKPRL